MNTVPDSFEINHRAISDLPPDEMKRAGELIAEYGRQIVETAEGLARLRRFLDESETA